MFSKLSYIKPRHVLQCYNIQCGKSLATAVVTSKRKWKPSLCATLEASTVLYSEGYDILLERQKQTEQTTPDIWSHIIIHTAFIYLFWTKTD